MLKFVLLRLALVSSGFTWHSCMISVTCRILEKRSWNLQDDYMYNVRTNSVLVRGLCMCRGGSRILVRGASGVLTPGGALSPKFAQNCLKTAWFWKKFGGRGPSGSVVMCVYFLPGGVCFFELAGVVLPCLLATSSARTRRLWHEHQMELHVGSVNLHLPLYCGGQSLLSNSRSNS